MKKGGPRSLSLLAVYDTIRIVDLLDTRITFCRLDHWLLIALNDLFRETVKMKMGNFLNFTSWSHCHSRPLFDRRSINLGFSMPPAIWAAK